MGSRSFSVFDREYPTNESIELLGRVVSNPRRPFDTCIPSLIKTSPSNEASSKWEEARKPFKIGTQLSHKVEAHAIKTAEAQAGFARIFNLGGTLKSTADFVLSSDCMRIYSLPLGDNQAVFQALKQDYASQIEEVLRSNGQAYMLVALRTAKDAQIERTVEEEKSGHMRSEIPLDAVAGIFPSTSACSIGAEARANNSGNSVVKMTTMGEIAFAAEYAEVFSSTNYQLALKMPLRPIGRHRNLKMRPTSSWGGSHLAMGTHHDSSESDEEENASNQELSEILRGYICLICTNLDSIDSGISRRATSCWHLESLICDTRRRRIHPVYFERTRHMQFGDRAQ